MVPLLLWPSCLFIFFSPTVWKSTVMAGPSLSENTEKNISSTLYFSRCSTRAKLHVIAVQFHQSLLVFLPLLTCLDCMLPSLTKQPEFCRRARMPPVLHSSIWRWQLLFLSVTWEAGDPFLLFKGITSLYRLENAEDESIYCCFVGKLI